MITMTSCFLLQTRILVTHGLEFLPQCDSIVVMDGGTITEVGNYSQLVESNGAFAEFLRNYANTESDEEGDPSEYNSKTSKVVDGWMGCATLTLRWSLTSCL